MDLRDFVQRLLQARGMQVFELGELLGYQSKTSLVRLQAGNVSAKSMESFARRVEDKLELTVEERRELYQLVRCFQGGNYQTYLEMERFLNLTSVPIGEFMLDGLQGMVLLSSLYQKDHLNKITVLNCTHVPIYQWLKKQIREQQTLVEQYTLNTGEPARTIHGITELLPILYEKSYFSYTIPRDSDIMGIYAADVLVVDYETSEGKPKEDFIVFDRADHGKVITASRQGQYQHLIGNIAEAAKPVKQTHFHCTMLEDYVGYSREFAALEQDCAKLIIKPDPCIALIPPEILAAAFADQCGEAGQALLESLFPVYQSRFNSFFHTKKPVHYLMKKTAMANFMQTGKTADHFWGMRPYTMEERIKIMENLLWNAENNPFFNAYLLKDDDLLRDIQLDLYEGKGLLILDAGTKFDLAAGHSEVLITQEQFLKSFKDYYLNELLKFDVMPQAEMLGCFYSLLAECKRMK